MNAADLADVNFACYFPPNSLVPQALLPEYLKDQSALTIKSAGAALKFSDILNIYYGSSNKGDLNVCNPHSFDYNIVGGLPVYAGLQSVTMNLTHMAGTLDNINLTIGFFDQGIVNIKWTWMNQTTDKRIPIEVPTSLIDTTPRDLSKM